jgi:hypothetical protein
MNMSEITVTNILIDAFKKVYFIYYFK